MLQTLETSAQIYPAFFNARHKRYLILMPYRQKDFNAWPDKLQSLLANPKFAMNAGVRTHAFKENFNNPGARPIVSNADGAILANTMCFPQEAELFERRSRRHNFKARTFGLHQFCEPIRSEIIKFQKEIYDTPFTLSLRREIHLTIEQLLALINEGNKRGFKIGLDRAGVTVTGPQPPGIYIPIPYNLTQVRYFKFSAHASALRFIQERDNV